MSETTTPEPEPDLVAQAVQALTAAARRTRTRGAGTPAEAVEPVDFGEIACRVLTAVAANVGGVEALLAGRPGSWEAEHVRRIVHSTAGDNDENLLAWRTEPIHLVVDVEDVWWDFGLHAMHEAELEAAEQRARTIDFHVNGDTDTHWVASEQEQAHLASETGRPADSWTAEDLETAERIAETIDTLAEQDKTAYFEAYQRTVREMLAELGVTAPVEVVRDDQPQTLVGDPVTARLHETARARTPLPMTGEAPDCSEGTPADALRRIGLTYTQRATRS